jgi:hypothetical protein
MLLSPINTAAKFGVLENMLASTATLVSAGTQSMFNI